MIEIPLNSSPEQLFSIKLLNRVYDFRVILNSRTGIWSMSIGKLGEPMLSGIALLGGVDLFYHHNVPIKNIYAVNLNDSTLDANKNNLGDTVKLIIIEEGDLDSE